MAEDDAYLAQYNGGALVATAVSFLALTYISVGLRTYVRIYLTGGFLVDDWLMLAAQAVFTISCTFILIGIKTGLGRHDKALPQNEEIKAIMWQALATATYILNMMLIKLSIGFFLLRLAVQKRYTYTVYASMVIVLIWSLALFFWDIFQCSPVQAQWDYTIPNLKCVSAQEVVNTAYALSVMTIVTDWLYALLPIPMIWKVKMNKQTKATVVVILGLGIFASIATLIRLKYLADLTDTSDILFAGTDAMVWTLVEPGVAITAASLVTIRPLLRQIRLKGFESTERGRSVPFNGRSLGSKTNRSKYSGMPDCGPDDLKLKDLEQGYGGAKGTSPQGTFVPSRTSTIGGRTIWGGAVEETLREADDEDQITPIGNDGAGSVVSTLISDGSMVESPRRAHQGQRTWRSETPLSSEESDQLQGLTYPSRRDAGSRMSRCSIPEFPVPVRAHQ